MLELKVRTILFFHLKNNLQNVLTISFVTSLLVCLNDSLPIGGLFSTDRFGVFF